jgi:hypothetical protein
MWTGEGDDNPFAVSNTMIIMLDRTKACTYDQTTGHWNLGHPISLTQARLYLYIETAERHSEPKFGYD